MNKKKLIIFLGLCLVWFGIIYYFSADEGFASDELSISVLEFFATIFSPTYRKLSGGEKYTYLLTLNNPFRKFAHVVEFFILACIVFAVVKTIMKKKPLLRNGVVALISFYICLMVAAFDEYHQLTVAGRNGSVNDVMIDCIGALIGLACVIFIETIKLGSKQRKRNIEYRKEMRERDYRYGVMHDKRTDRYLEMKRRRR